MDSNSSGQGFVGETLPHGNSIPLHNLACVWSGIVHAQHISLGIAYHLHVGTLFQIVAVFVVLVEDGLF